MTTKGRKRRRGLIRPQRLMGVLLGGAVIGTHFLPQMTSQLTHFERVEFSGYDAAGARYAFDSVKEDNGTSTVARWNPCQKDITYEVDLNRLPVAKRSGTLSEIKRGFGMLSKDDGIPYRYRGTTDFVLTKEDLAKEPAEIVVAAEEKTDTDLKFDNALGFGGIVWANWEGSNGDGAAIVRGYVVLSPKGLASLNPGYGRGLSQGNLILHELGHATGLEHAGRSSEVMHATLSKQSPAGYARGDRDGLARIGAAGGCVKIPSGVGPKDLS